MERSFQLRLYPHPVLRQVANPVKEIDEGIQTLINGMAETLHACDGIGLSAPQVGVLQRVIVVDTKQGLLALTNPEILDRQGEDEFVEGCLSLPNVRVNVDRNNLIVVRGTTAEGEEFQQEYSGLEARVIQHVFDHLNGVLIIDHARRRESGNNGGLE
ncbi:peptide deformylase [bacterium]|nr:MAG: peptide deformylase [bacterium]